MREILSQIGIDEQEAELLWAYHNGHITAEAYNCKMNELINEAK